MIVPFYIRPSTTDLSLQEGGGFNDSPSLSFERFYERFGHYELEGRKLHVDTAHSTAPLFSIHGARSDYSSLDPLLYPLQLLGVASVSFNLSGHNPVSGVPLASTSLSENLQECAVFSTTKGMVVRNILGFSLGGALALKVAEVHKNSVERIILFAPALYTEQAYLVPFGPVFKQKISSPFNFLDSKSLSFLKSFKGKVLLVIGEYDGLSAQEFGCVAGTSVGNVTLKNQALLVRDYYSAIPSEVVNALEQHITPNNFQKIILSECDHSIMTWLRKNPDVAKTLSEKITDFLK